MGSRHGALIAPDYIMISSADLDQPRLTKVFSFSLPSFLSRLTCVPINLNYTMDYNQFSVTILSKHARTLLQVLYTQTQTVISIIR